MTQAGWIAIGILFSILAVAQASAQVGSIAVNQKRIRIEDFVKKVGEANQRTILLPDDVRGTISIISQRRVSPEEGWAMLESSLGILGFSLLPSTVDSWRIVKVADAVGEAPFRRRAEDAGESYVTTLIPLNEATPANVLKVLEPLSGSRVTLVPYEATNSVIASGSERAIARLAMVAAELDQVEEQTLRLRVLRYRDVSEVEGFVETFMQTLGVVGRDLQIWSDQRTNAILIRGAEEAVDRTIQFLGDVDQPIEGGGTIQILRVLHRDVEEVAELIRSLADPGGAVAGEGESAEAATALDGADYSIAVDGPSHSIVVRSDAQTYAAIREMVEILDAPVELIAVDITISELRTPSNYGLAFGFAAPFTKGNNTDDLVGFVANDPAAGIGSDSNVLGRIQRDSGVTFDSIDGNGDSVTLNVVQSAEITATKFEAVNNVLIQPSLVLTAGEQHEIFVGDNIPIPVTGETPGGDRVIRGVRLSDVSRTITFDRRDIGTRVGIEATVGRKGKIQLDLEIDLTGIDPTAVALGGNPLEVGPSFIQENLSVTARLNDGQSAVLAMNTQRKETDVATGIPFLRDLPFFGGLFSGKAKLGVDTRLMIVARARRVSSPAELVADTIRRRLAFERQSARHSNLPEVKGSPYAVRVTTRSREDDAKSIAESIELQGDRSLVHKWSVSGQDYFDVYVTGLPSLVEAAQKSEMLDEEGWSSDLVIFPERL